MAGGSPHLTNTCAPTTTAASYKGTEQTIGPKGNRNPVTRQTEQAKSTKRKGTSTGQQTRQTSTEHSPSPEYTAVNPSQATDKPCPGELHHKKSITPVLGPSLVTGASRNTRNPVRGALASPHSKVMSVRKSKEDKRKRQKKTRKKYKRKTKERQKKPYLVGPHNFRLLFLFDRSRTVKRQCLL